MIWIVLNDIANSIFDPIIQNLNMMELNFVQIKKYGFSFIIVLHLLSRDLFTKVPASLLVSLLGIAKDLKSNPAFVKDWVV